MATITDWSDLEVAFLATCDGSCGNGNPNSKSISVSWVVLELDPPVFSRPISDTGVDWTGENGCAGTQHWECINEVIPNNVTDYITSGLISTSNDDIDFIGLSGFADPLKSDGHVLRVEAREEGLGTNAPYLLAYLSSASTDIAVLNITQGTLTTTFTQYEYALTPAEADSITDYSDLELRLEASCNAGTCSAGGARDSVSVSWFEFVVLDEAVIPPATLDIVSVVNNTALEINFTAPIDLSNVVSYDIRRDNGTQFVTVGNILNATTLSFIDGGLAPDTFYNYHIVTIGSGSVESIPSNVKGQKTTEIISSARPDSNPSVRWVNGLGNPPCSDLATWACVDEEEIDNNDFIQTIGLGNGDQDIDIMTLSDIDDPLKSTDHTLTYTLREAGVGDNPVGFTIELRQGVTTIATFTHPQGTIPSSYTTFKQTLTGVQADSITDYTDLEVVLTGTCAVGCVNNPQNLEKLNVSFIQFEIESVSAPPISSVHTVTTSTLRVSWGSLLVDPEITDIIIQKQNNTDFINIGSVPDTTFSFDETGIPREKIVKYRLLGMLPSGFSKPSISFEGATPPTSANLNGNGTVIEPSSTNSFTEAQRANFAQTVEFYNVDEVSVQAIITDIETNQLNAYQIIDKMINGSYSGSDEMLSVGSYYGTDYLSETDVTAFLNKILDKIVNATGSRGTQGDNPQYGVANPPE